VIACLENHYGYSVVCIDVVAVAAKCVASEVIVGGKLAHKRGAGVHVTGRRTTAIREPVAPDVHAVDFEGPQVVGVRDDGVDMQVPRHDRRARGGERERAS